MKSQITSSVRLLGSSYEYQKNNLKIISKKLLLLFFISSVISCEGIQYDGETRLVFQTVVLNSNGEPLTNSHVEISVGNAYSSALISKGKTNQNGSITLVFPAPKDDLGINLKVYNDDASYLQKEVLNIHKSDFENYKFIYQNDYLLKADETAPLVLTYNHSSPYTALKVSVNGIYYMDQELYNFNYDTDFNILPYEILIKKNQSFQLKYTVLNMQTNVETEYIVDLTIGTNPLNYSINY
ncbi:hypothetical protein [Flavobacterium sp.]|uniref:hypothetical protein n=1 Tax=Flavobacterium sp. TaxID=239 RepID=UPI0025E972FD|nr:hypothetical protein [Flavobacterium sp.]